MRVIVRATNPGTLDGARNDVTVEIRASSEEMRRMAHKSPKLETAIEESVEEFLRSGTRITREVDTGRG